MPGLERMTASAAIQDIVRSMTAQEKVGQLVMAYNAPGRSDYSDVHALIREYNVGSVISFGYGGMDPAQTATYNNELQRTALDAKPGIPVLNAGDFEQGLATVMPGHVTDFPSQMGLGATGDSEGVERAAEIAGREERALGFHWTFAPVADVNVNPANPVIGVRSFGSDARQVAELTARQVIGYRRGGVLATAKHFPGHGDTSVDSHRGLPVIPDDWETVARVHLPPFQTAIQHRVGAIMTAHIIVQALDPDLPGTLSPRVLTGLLRERLGYDGIIVTDAMSMEGVSVRWGMTQGSVMAVQAGADVVIADGPTEAQVQIVEALRRAVKTGHISEERLDASVLRVLTAKQACGLLDDPFVDTHGSPGEIATPEHNSQADHLAVASMTLVKNDGILPFERQTGRSTLVVGITGFSQFGGPPVSHVPRVAEIVQRESGDPVIPWQSATEDPSDDEISEVVDLASSSDRLLVLTYGRGTLPPGQVRMVQALMHTQKPLVAIATGTPYDIAQYPEIKAYLAAYALGFVPTMLGSPRVLHAAIRVVFGMSPRGRLPVAIPELYPVGHGLRYGN